jgi:hypothetical protein
MVACGREGFDAVGAVDAVDGSSRRFAFDFTQQVVFANEDLSRFGPFAWFALVAGEGGAIEDHDVLQWDITLTP